MVLFFFFLLPLVRCHCPHMAKLHKVEGPSAPAHLPPGDKGWDWDESAAPGSLPQEHFIQTSLVQRALTGEEKSFGLRLEEQLKKLQDRLRKEARVTVDNENIGCGQDETHYRCADFPPTGSYHFLVVEDSSSGAAIYSVDRKHNSKSDGSIEMAILDALSRHSVNPLTVYASKEAEKEIGFVRKLSVKEIENLNAKPTVHVPRRSPIELNLFEAKVLELRSTAGLETVSGSQLTVFSSQEEFEETLKKHSKLAVLFWSNTDSVSVHVHNIFARLSANFKQTGVLLAHVECHLHSSFCTGLGPRDFRTVVAYSDGENAASTDLLGSEEYYDKWIRLALKGPLVRLEDDSEVAAAKKGNLLETHFPAITVATFGDEGSASFKHYKIAAERLIGRYALTYRIKKGAAEAVATFRPLEKRKRADYEGRFDPASLIQFISTSSEPSVIDTTHGFSTDALFHQPKPVLLLEGAEDSFVEKAGSSEEIRKNVLVIKQNSPQKIAEALKLESTGPVAILFNKDQVSWTQLPDSVEKLGKWLKVAESEVLLSHSSIHPLRLLQVASADDKFGKQEIMLLPDRSLFQEVRDDSPEVSSPPTGGCPFMSGGGAAQHEEL